MEGKLLFEGGCFSWFAAVNESGGRMWDLIGENTMECERGKEEGEDGDRGDRAHDFKEGGWVYLKLQPF